MQNLKETIPVINHRPRLMKIKPLWLREKLFWKLYHQKNSFSAIFEHASLEFAPNVSLKLMPTDISHKQIAFLGFSELLPSRRIAQLAKTGGLMIDVGANYGYYSCIWAAANSKNRVVAFEASPRNFPALKLNLINNGLEAQVDVQQTAVGKERGSLPFMLGPEEQSSWGGLLVDREKGEIQVPVVSLDEVFLNSQNDYIEVLKIDVEGADTWVLQGAEQLLRSHKIHHIFFEENLVRMSALNIEPEEAQTLLRDYGYSLKSLGPEQWYATIE
ncbi:MAG TPA: FkbM family methyltransferase [Coleofasciculaceae cyanobacterium]|jgi:FkbM family methyltransferase